MIRRTTGFGVTLRGQREEHLSWRVSVRRPGGPRVRDAATPQRAWLRLGRHSALRSARRRAPRGPRPEVRGSAARARRARGLARLRAARGFRAERAPGRSCRREWLGPRADELLRCRAPSYKAEEGGRGPAARARATGGLWAAGGPPRGQLGTPAVPGGVARPCVWTQSAAGRPAGSLLPRAQASGRPEGTPADPGAATGTRGAGRVGRPRVRLPGGPPTPLRPPSAGGEAGCPRAPTGFPLTPNLGACVWTQYHTRLRWTTSE